MIDAKTVALLLVCALLVYFFVDRLAVSAESLTGAVEQQPRVTDSDRIRSEQQQRGILHMPGRRTSSWPELRGTDADAAVATISNERPDLNVVYKAPQNAFYNTKFDPYRVLVFYNQRTNLVIGVPKVG